MAEKKQCTIILKGAPTFIFHPQTAPLIITTGDPGMATAGSGDVLTGVVAALVAQKLEMRTAAALGAYIHGLAGERAAELFTSYSLVASDIIAHLSDAFFESK
jgi:NAD(P)H-hydrate repair Nnr-like enzyme with NAD(P)H-hydrate dehydratase domain